MLVSMYGFSGKEVAVELEHGKILYITLRSVGPVDAQGNREVIFEVSHSFKSMTSYSDLICL